MHRTLYDTTKVVEAIVHTRHVGANVPIFRLDWDVLFNDENLKNGLRLQNAVMKAVDYYSEHTNDPHVSSFLFSASYTRPPDPLSSWQLEDWMGAFATRVFPSLLATDDLLRKPVSCNPKTLAACFHTETTQKFYGVTQKSKHGELKSVGGVAEIGSDPLTSVISGALLCMSDGAILDLPPFSNFRQNVSWIDDHLKYSLHRELKHLKSYEICGQPRRERPAQVPDCQARKNRPHTKDIAQYVLGTYLPTLVYGCIVDAWIQPDSRAKTSARGRSTGVFSKALQDALKHGHFPDDDKLAQLQKDLEHAAWGRLEKVRHQWANLKGPDGHETFASLWVGKPTAIKSRYNRKHTDNDWVGWGLLKDDGILSIRSGDDLNPAIARCIEELIDDALTYIEWALQWPRFVQSIRAVEPGTLRTDLNWEEPRKP